MEPWMGEGELSQEFMEALEEWEGIWGPQPEFIGMEGNREEDVGLGDGGGPDGLGGDEVVLLGPHGQGADDGAGGPACGTDGPQAGPSALGEPGQGGHLKQQGEILAPDGEGQNAIGAVTAGDPVPDLVVPLVVVVPSGFVIRPRRGLRRVGPFACRMCGKIFPQLSMLDRHMVIHKGQLKCQYCEATYAHQTTFTKHIAANHQQPGGPQ